MKKMIEIIKKTLATVKRTHQESAACLRSLLYDNRAMQAIAM